MMLCFSLEFFCCLMKTVVSAHCCFKCRRAVLTQRQHFSCCLTSVGLGVHKSLRRDTARIADQMGHQGISESMASH